MPPAIIVSASSRRIVSQASPIAWPPVAHADTVVKFGPDHPVADRDLAGADVGDAHRDEERADPVGPAEGIDRDAVDERPGAAEAGAEDDPGPLGLLALDPVREAGLVHRLARGHEPELDVAVGPADLLAIEDVARIEVVDLAGDLAVDPRRVEGLDHPDAGLTGDSGRAHDVATSLPRAVIRPMPVTTTRRGSAGQGRGFIGRASRFERWRRGRRRPAGPRAEIAFETVIVSYSVRRISALTVVAVDRRRAPSEAVGSPSKT